MPHPNRGEVWWTDLGRTRKIRPCVDLSVPPMPQDHVVCTLVSHTTSVAGTRFEVVVPKPFLHSGAFDCRGLANVHPSKMLRKVGSLTSSEMTLIEDAVKLWLGM